MSAVLLPTTPSEAVVNYSHHLTAEVPGTIDGGDAQATEVGVDFTSSKDGTLTALRFYKAVNNTGTHTAVIRNEFGQVIFSGDYSSESASGWQELELNPAIPIEAGKSYAASYFAPNGHYSYEGGVFNSTQVRGPLTFTGGVYSYSTPWDPGTAVLSASSADYWVDVVFADDYTSEVDMAISIPKALALTVAPHVGDCNGVSQTAGVSASSTAIDFGGVTGGTSIGAQDVIVDTNAAYGFNVYVRYGGPLADAEGNDFTNVTPSNTNPGAFTVSAASAFGYTTSESALAGGTADRFTSPSANWAGLSMSDEEVSSSPGPVADDTVCVAYGARGGDDTPAGHYTTAIVYTVVPSF